MDETTPTGTEPGSQPGSEAGAEQPTGETPCAESTRRQFEREVHREELDYVGRRREAAGAHSGPVESSGGPSTANGLVGLALSGGGIRSATFNLGILQALHRWGVLKEVDFLSTVSGGGFIGSSLTWQMSQDGKFPFEGESPQVVHLRNNSNYLAPRGLLDYLRMFAVLIRGIILNFLVLVPLLLVPCLITALVYGPQLLSRLRYDENVQSARRYLEASAIADGVEIEGGRPVAPLLDLLKKRGFVPLRVAQNDLLISAALQERNSSYREVTEPLITGMGSESVPHTFLPGVTLRDVACRLLEARLLEEPDAIEEVQAVELHLRRQGLRFGSKADKGDPRKYINGLSAHLSSRGEIRPFMPFVSAQTLVASLNRRKILLKKGTDTEAPKQCPVRLPWEPAESDGDGGIMGECDFARADNGTRLYSFTQVLQAFYDDRLYDRRWLDLHRSAAHDADLRYRWPNDEPNHREVEAAALALWQGLDGPVDSVAGFFASLAGMSRPGERDALIGDFGYREQKDLLSALKAARLVKTLKGAEPCEAQKTGESKEKKKKKPRGQRDSGDAMPVPDSLAGCRFEDAFSPLGLPALLYRQELYNVEWFEAQFVPEAVRRRTAGGSLGLERWLDPPYQLHYGSQRSVRGREIEAAREALGLQPGDSVRRVVEERLENLKTAKKLVAAASSGGARRGSRGKKSGRIEEVTPLISGRRATREKVLAALKGANLVEARTSDADLCSAERLDGCYFTSGDSIEMIPGLFYDREFYNRGWFEDRWDPGEIAYRKRAALAASKILEGSGKTVGDVFRYLDREEIVAAEALGKAFDSLRAEGLIVGECTFAEMKGCSFKSGRIDGALHALYDRGDLKAAWLAENVVDERASRINQLYSRLRARAVGALSRSFSPFAERVQWNPHHLRVPLTGLVAVGGLFWVLLFPLVVLVSRSLANEELRKRDVVEKSFSIFMIAIAGVAFFELQPYLIYHWHYLDLGANWSLVLGGASLISTLAAGPALSFFEKFGRSIVILLVSILGPLLPFIVYLTVMNQLIYSESWPTRAGYNLDMGYVVLFFALAALLVHLFLLALDPNSTSIHNFYRDRLSAAYLVGSRASGERLPSSSLRLSELCPDGKPVPYHLVNVALNLQGSRRADLRDRRSDFFIFSKYFVGGGKCTGYCTTEAMQDANKELGLDTAMAVSGAAAAPNMGAFTVGPLVVLLALLNIRLGYWLQSPRAVCGWMQQKDRGRWRWLAHLKGLPRRLVGCFRLRPGPYLFLKELASRMNDTGGCINISDGGHLENTAAFELLRRRCKYVIVCDAEADRKMNFAGLATLIRYARIDLNVEIQIDTQALRLQKARSGRHLAVGKITYPEERGRDEQTGYLIYLKASVSGDEDQIVTEYRRRHPEFPHQSTADQFFDERQFEAYRALGFHVGEGFCSGLDEKHREERTVLEWLYPITRDQRRRADTTNRSGS